MNKKIFKYETMGFIFVAILGTVNHFMFEWFNNMKIIGLFCPVNESIFEHLKLLFFPYLIWSIIEYFILEKPFNFFTSKIIGVIFGNIFITAFYYTYSGIIGNNYIFMDILTFLLGILVAFATSYLIMTNPKYKTNYTEVISMIIFIVISLIFFLFTFYPPFIPFFKDMTTNSYGI